MGKLLFTIVGLVFVWIIMMLGPSLEEDYIIDKPKQTLYNKEEPFIMNGYTITKKAEYEVNALILSKKEYDDKQSDLIPLDLALGWQEMAKKTFIDDNEIIVGQSNRWYQYKYSLKNNSDVGTLIKNMSSNHHLIPQNDFIRDELLSLNKYDVITLKGWLVDVKKGNLSLNTSLSREDSRGGACEIMLVSSISKS